MRYAHPTPENKRRAVDVLASVLRDRSYKENKIRSRTPKAIFA